MISTQAHWTDEQLIASLYGIGPGDDHLSTCAHCQNRLAAMRANRQSMDAVNRSDEPRFELLAVQRRAILANLARPVRVPLFLSTAAATLALCASVLVYEHNHAGTPAKQPSKISDIQLSEDVAHLAGDAEPQPITPLHALFQE